MDRARIIVTNKPYIYVFTVVEKAGQQGWAGFCYLLAFGTQFWSTLQLFANAETLGGSGDGSNESGAFHSCQKTARSFRLPGLA